MRLLLTILLFPFFAQATNYYVSNTGSDAANGLTPATAWQTIAKVNASAFSAGDTIFFKKGDAWREALRLSSSGTSGNPIVISAYGTGAAPILTGLQSATGWTDSSGIWIATLTNSVPYQNTIIIDGKMRAKGRYPNTTYLGGLNITNLNSFTTTSVLPDTYVGAEIGLQSYAWIWDVAQVASQSGTASGSTITTREALTYNTGICYYFFQNDPRFLDLDYEWAYDSVSKKIRVKLDSEPSLRYSTIDTVISLHGVSYITLDGLTVTGGNRANISTDTTRNIVIQNCTLQYGGANALWLNKSHQTTVQNTTIADVWNNGLYTRWSSDTCSFLNNTWQRLGITPGMNLSGNSASCGATYWGAGGKLEGNRMDSMGYHGWYWLGARDTVKHNYITNWALSKNDGGAIYTAGAVAPTGSYVGNNIISGGMGLVVAGTANPTGHGSGCVGIYMDNFAAGATIENNTVSDTYQDAIALNGGGNFTIRNNTVWNGRGRCFLTVNSSALSNVTLYENIFYSTLRGTPVVYHGITGATILSDSNYVLRDGGADSLFRYGQTLAYYSLSGWRTAFDRELATTASFPAQAVSTTPTLYSNPSQSDSTILFGGRKVDARGVEYNGQVTLQAYESALLFPMEGGSAPARNKRFFGFKRIIQL